MNDVTTEDMIVVEEAKEWKVGPHILHPKTGTQHNPF